jgi:amino acid adenylation domain-containing protein
MSSTLASLITASEPPGDHHPIDSVARSRDGGLPWSLAQERLWLADRFQPGNPLYHPATALRLRGQLDNGALAGALTEVVRRHEVLRARFLEVDGSPVQEIAPAVGLVLPLVDLSGLMVGLREVEFSCLTGEEARRPLRLGQGSPLRAMLLRFGGEEHALLLTLHPIVADAWSLAIFLREMETLYHAFSSGRVSPLPKLPAQYADFAEWQRLWLSGKGPKRELAYWRSELAGVHPELALPADRSRPAIADDRGESRLLRLSRERAAALHNLAQRGEAPLFSVLAAGFCALLARYTGQDDLCVGTTVAGRNRAELTQLIGCFANTLVLRGDLTGEPDFRELLRRTRKTVRGAQAHQNLPFELLVEELWPGRSLGQSPLFQAMFLLQDSHRKEVDRGPLFIEPLPAGTRIATCDLTLSLIEDDEGLAAVLTYRSALFDGTTAARLLVHLDRLFAAAAERPDLPLSVLPLLSSAQQHQLVAEWNAEMGNARLSAGLCVHQLIALQAARTPQAPAVIGLTESLSFAELEARAEICAQRLAGLGVGPEVVVGICLRRTPDLIVALLGVLKAGGAYLPLRPDDPAPRLGELLADAGARLVVTEPSLRDGFAASDWAVITLADESPVKRLAAVASRRMDDESLAYVLYTSGSTGRPKGVMVPHRALLSYLSWATAFYGCYQGEGGAPLHSSIGFDLTVTSLFAPLLAGRPVHLLPEEQGGLSLIAALAAAPDFGLVKLTPAHLEVVNRELPPTALAGTTRVLIIGGEALPAAALDPWRTHASSVRLINEYGPTETVVGCSIYEIGPDAPATGTVPIGRPIPGVALHVLDPGFRLVPLGAVGELYIGGATLGRGYLHRPDLTAKRFLPDPFADTPGARLYHSGDLVRRLADGCLLYLGRADHQVKLRGFRIEPGEIEAALERHPTVGRALVLAHGEAESRRLVAYAVAVPGEAVAETRELRFFLATTLPDYMVPSSFVRLTAFPLSPNGKIDRRALPAPEPEAAAAGARELPRTPIEDVVAEAWATVLGHERVGIHDSFFELGGHSLSALRVLSRLRDVLAVELPLSALLQEPTIAALARRASAALATERGVTVPLLVPVPRDRPPPLSYEQQGLWFLAQLTPDSSFYNLPLALDLEGPLAPSLLARSLAEVVRRHEVLRTTFALVGGAAVQVIRAASPVPMPCCDLSGLAAAAGEREAERLALAEALTPFDLARGPLLRAHLLRRGRQHHTLVLNLHHIVSDAWSTDILLAELVALYGAFAAGRASPLLELPLQYADFAVWQRGRMQSPSIAATLTYWKAQLGRVPPLLELPGDRPRPAAQSYRGAARFFRLPAPLCRGLQALARQDGATLFMAILAAFDILLLRLSGRADLVVGSPMATRGSSELELMIGLFVNMLPLRTWIDRDGGFRAALGAARETALAAYAHQDLPFEVLVEALAPERDLSHNPIFQIALVSDGDVPGGLALAPDLALRSREVEGKTAQFDLTLYFASQGDELVGRLVYSTDLFDATTVSRLAGSFERLLAAAVAEPQRPVAELPLLSPAERRQLLAEWNDTRRLYPEDAERLTLHQLFEAQVARTPQAPAVTFAGQSVSYSELDRRADALAAHLRTLGVGPEGLVAIAMERSLELMVAFLGVLKAGAAYLPLDPEYPAASLAFMLSDARPSVLLTQEHLLPQLPRAEGPVLCLDRALPLAAAAGREAAAVPDELGLAYVIYTSGSTGRPKGAMLHHQGIRNRLLWMQETYRLTAADVVLQKTPASFDVSVWELFWPLIAGARLVLARPGGHRESDYLVDLIAAERVSVLHFVPSMLQIFLAAPDLGRCASLRLVICSGEALPVELERRFFERLGADLGNLYGPTEASVDVTFWRCEPASSRRSVPLGRPIANTRLYLLDARREPVPIGVPGELYIGGSNVGRGYLARPELTAEHFVPDPAGGPGGVPGSRLYRTGDLARTLGDGTIEFLGRADQQVKIRGFRIELGEIEAVLATHEAVANAAVLARAYGTDRRLVGCVAVHAERQATEPELQEFLRARLPEHMVPGVWVFLPALPLSPNGKIDRRALSALEPERFGAARDAAAWKPPETALERSIASIWQELLGLDRVGIDERFFDRGGNSLTAMQVVSRLRDVLGVDLPVRAFFEQPTVAGLAQRVGAALGTDRGAAMPALVPVPRDRPLPLSLSQQGLWILAQLVPDSPFYNVPSAVELTGSLDVARLARSLDEVVRRHEVLRTVFAAEGGSAVQVVQVALAVPLPCFDLSGMAAPEGEREAARLALEEILTPFDLTRGPLLRARLLRHGAEHSTLVLNLHHIISDGWSIEVLLAELAALYGAFAAGSPSPLPALPFQYADFAVWQRTLLEQGFFAAPLAYWKAQLAGAPPLQGLPGDRPRPAVQSYRGAVHCFHLPAALSGALKALARHHDGTPFMALLAAFDALLLRMSGREDLVVGSPAANRSRSELEGLIGFFVSTLPLRTLVDPEGGFDTLLGTVREVALAAFAHQELPFEILIEELAPERDLSRNPLFQIAFALQGAGRELALTPDLALRRSEVDWKTSHFDLTLYTWDQGDEITGRFAYSTDLFDEATVARLAACLRTLAEGATAHPGRAIAALPLLGEAEVRQLTAEWNAAAVEAPRELLRGFAAAAATPALSGEPWLRLVDSRLQPVPYGVAGEVLVGGLASAAGLPAEMAATLVPDPFGRTSGGWLLRTGEHARWRSGGRLERLGRTDGCLWVEGVKVDLAEVESALLEDPGVADCAVLAREIEAGRWEPVAYVVAEGMGSLAALRGRLAARLPRVQVPQHWVPISAVPLTAAGGVDAENLEELPIVDAERIRRWEESLRRLPGVGEVAVVVRESRAEDRPLHLAAVLPGWRRTTGPVVGEETAVAVETAADDEERRPSISHGEPLVLAPDAPRTLPEALLRAAQRSPQRGIVYLAGLEREDGEIRQTYPELLVEARRILSGLRALGLEPGDRVILQLELKRDFVPVFWGCLLGGFVPAPVSVPPTYGERNAAVQTLLNAWELLGRPWIVAGDRLAGEVRKVSEEPILRVVPVGTLRLGEPAAELHEPSPGDLALLLLTSGSTGVPKAVQQSHAALLERSAGTAQLDGFGPADVSLNWMPLEHVGGIVMFHLRDVWSGCEQVQAPIEPVLRRPLLWLDWIERFRATISWAPNFAYGLVADQAELASSRWDLSSMRFFLNGGEAIVARTARRFLTLLAPHGLPPTAMHPAWGMSETCSGVTSSHAFQLETTGDGDPFVEVGGPIPGVSLRIVDAENRPVPEGRTGQLQVKGTPVTSGYFGRPELDREVFTADGWFKTGDLSYLRQGRLTITGREKDVIIVNGINYYSHEIEAVVEEMAGVEVANTAACGVRVGGDTECLAVFFTPRVAGDELRQLLQEMRGRVSRRAGLTPEYLVPVAPQEIPKTSIGKIQRPLLKMRFEAGEFEEALQRVDLLLGNTQTLPDWFFRRVWRRERVRGRATGLPAGRYLLLLDGEGLGERLRETLAGGGRDCRTVVVGSGQERIERERYRLDPSAAEPYRWLAESLAREGWWPDRVLHLWSCETTHEIGEARELERAQDLGVLAILSLVQALAAVRGRDERLELMVVSAGVQAVAAGERVASARATLSGLLKTIPAELPWIRCRHVDLEVGETAGNAVRVLGELAAVHGGAEVAYRGGRRFVPRLEKVDPRRRPGRELPFLDGGFYLLSGGLGGIGVEVSAFLLERYGARLLLVGRTELAEATAGGAGRRRALDGLRPLGGEVVYEALDVADEAAVAGAVARAAARFGRPLDGVLHLAGVLGERLLLEESRESFAATLRAKVLGSWVLHRQVAGRRGTLFVSCSSVNGSFGGATVGAYAAANSFVDSFAQQQRGEGLRAWSLAWSRWNGVGMSRSYGREEMAQSLGYRTLSPKQGLESLQVALLQDEPQLSIGLDGSRPWIRRHVEERSRRVERPTVCFTGELPAERARELLQESRLELLHLAALPRTAAGEIDRARLVLAAGEAHGTLERQGPRTEVEQQVARLWSELLGVAEVGVEDNFFESGGHSLLATQLLSRLRESLGVEVPLRQLFETPTVAGLAAAAVAASATAVATGEAQPAIRRVPRDGELPLSFAQQRLWFLDRFEPGGNFYNIPAAFRLAGRVDRGALERSLGEIVRRHEALRTTFETRDGKPVQCIASPRPFRLREIDLTALPVTRREAGAREASLAEAENPFDLGRGPLFRASLLALSEREHILILNLHHIVSDGWSMGVLLRELTLLYRSTCLGELSSLRELPIQYADFAFWQRQTLAGDALAEHLAYWRQHLAGAPRSLDLPTDWPRPAVQSFRGLTYSFRLPAALSAALRSLGQREGVTLFMTLFAAFEVLLYRYTGQDDLVVGAGIANRNRIETEPLIGFFVNTMAMRTSLAGNPSFHELLLRVREVAMGAYAHQDLPFEKLVEELRPERDLGRNPLVQVAFVLQNAPLYDLELPGLTLSPVELEVAAAKFDFLLLLSDTEPEITGLVEWKSDLFKTETITRMVSHYCALLAAFTADSGRRVRMVSLFAAEVARAIGTPSGWIETVAPLNPTQRDLFLDHFRDPESVVYSLGVSARLPVAVDPRLWAQAVAAVIESEPVAGSRFLFHRGEPLQVVERRAAAHCEVIDLPAEPSADSPAETVWAALIEERVKIRYRLGAGNLLRSYLVRGLPGGDVALLAYHHIVADAISGRLLLGRIAAAYEALAAGRQVSAAPQAPSFLETVGESLARFDTPEAERFWAQRLRPVVALELHSGVGRPSRARASRAILSGAPLAALRGACSSDLSLAALLRGLFGVLLGRLFDPDGDLLLYDVVNGRTREQAKTFGCFHQVVPVVFTRQALAFDAPVADFLAAARTYRRRLGEAQNLSVLLERRLLPGGTLRFFYNFYNFARFELLGGRTTLAVHDSFPADEVHLVASDTGDQVELSLYWNDQAFADLSLLDRLLGMARQVVAGASRLGDLEVQLATERREILVWNDTAVSYPEPDNLALLLAAQERRTPLTTAVICEGERLSYRELHRRANQLAHLLRELGVGPEAVVAIAVERSFDMVISLLAVLKAGGAYLPLDPDYPAERLRFMLADSGATLLLLGKRGSEGIGGIAGLGGLAAAGIPTVRLAEVAEDVARRPETSLPPRATGLNLAYVIYTSGSTGQPKGAMNTHRAIANRLLWMQQTYGLASTDRVLQKTPLSFDVSVWEVFWPLITGACLVLARPEGQKDAAYLVRLIREQRITTLHFVPSMLRIFLAEREVAGCDSLRRVIASGEELPRELVERFVSSLPAELHNLYGPTEAAVDVTFWACRQEGGPEPVPIGRPVANTAIHLLDGDLRPVPVGIAGELYIGGVQLARGYLGRPGLTAARFLPNPCGTAAGGRLYRTGDRARRRPDGVVEYLGRLDHQVKLRGFRIELGEIEAALGRLPAVRQALALVREETGGRSLVAYLVGMPAGGDEERRPSHGELTRLTRERLPEHMVPAHFVWLEELPHLPNGKVDRRALPAPQASRPELEIAYTLAASELERALVGIWQEVLHLPKVGAMDNFFDLGGHSLLLVQVQTRLRELYSYDLPIVDLFRHPTARSLAGYLEGLGRAGGAVGEERRAEATPAVPAGEAQAGNSIAVIGLAGRFPQTKSLSELWQKLRAGEELITAYSMEELAAAGVDPELLRNPAYVRAKGALADVESFDAGFFGYSPREAEVLDPQQRLFLEAAWEALEDAGYDPPRAGCRVGVFAGQSFNTYLLANLYPNPRLMAAVGLFQAVLGNDKDYLTTRTSYKLGLEGPSVNVQTACSTSLVAVHLACRSLLDGECDMALAGGVSVSVPAESGYLYQAGSIISPDGHCRAFDAEAQGTVPGNGLGIVVLKRRADAERDGDTIRAVILGSAINNDGSRKVGFTAPSAAGQSKVIAEALRRAGVGAETIGLIEAHGTGTPLGDPIELAALGEVFGVVPERRGTVALGSIKSNLGHLDAAAGVAGLIKVVLALEQGEIPPTLHVTRPNPELGLDAGPFYLNTRVRQWPRGGSPRRAGVSAFGIGGSNAHVILEEAPERLPEPAVGADSQAGLAALIERPHLLVLSARTEAELATATANLADDLRRHPEVPLADVAWTLAAGRHLFAHRRAVVCSDREQALAALAGGRVFTGHEESTERPVAFLFPGQGSQHVAMAAGLYAAERGFRERVDRCAEILAPQLGLDLRQILYPAVGREAEAQRLLDRTRLAQPALFTVELALAGLWMDWGLRPTAMLGHSLGELVAATLAGVFELADALWLVALRGKLVDAQPVGAMLSVPLAESELLPLLDAELSLAAINGPSLSVVSGGREAIERLARRLEEDGVVCRQLHTSHAFHSLSMEPVMEPFAEVAGRLSLRPPKIPFLSGTTGTWITAQQAVDPWYWARHLRQPIRFADGVERLAANPAPILLEVGPGNTLSSLVRRQLGEARATPVLASLPHPKEHGTTDLETVTMTVGKLWLCGAEIDWAGCKGEARRRRVPLPTYPFSRQRYWVEAPGIVAARSGAAAAETAAPLPAPAPLPAYLGAARLRAYSPPEGEIEEAVAAAWGALLGIDRVGRDDNFFELGGHSLMGIQLFARLRERFAVEIPADSLFESPTVAALSARIEELVLDHLDSLSEEEAASWVAESELRTGEESSGRQTLASGTVEG